MILPGPTPLVAAPSPLQAPRGGTRPRRPRRRLAALGLLALALAAIGTAPARRARAAGPDDAPTAWAGWPQIDARLEGPSGRRPLRLWLAATPEHQAAGMMHRRTLGGLDGMVFAFARAAPRTFWMHDTPMALDLVFFGADGRCLGDIPAAAPNTDDDRPSPGPAQWVLELPAGTWARWGGARGVRLVLSGPASPPRAPAEAPGPRR